jgi:Ca-activated chloride channel family protein
VNFLAAGRLWFLLVPAVLLLVYAALQFRATRYAVVLPTTGLAARIGTSRRWHRHVIAALFAIAIALMVVALARPAHTVEVPRHLTVVMVALDTSTSMQANDVRPARIDAAKVAAERFVDQLPGAIRVGLVTFSGDVAIRVPPTLDRAAVLTALEHATTADGTAIGEAVYRSLDAIRHGEILETTQQGVNVSTARGAPGSGIVLLSDGETTVGRSPADAAIAARDAHVRVSTIAYGTQSGTVTVNGKEFAVPVHTSELRSLANTTGGRFLEATSAPALRSAYTTLGRDLGYQPAQRELATGFLAGAFVLALLALAGSVAWYTRIP